MLLRRLSLTFKMLALTATVGLVVWAITDSFQSHKLETLFKSKLAERFSQQAEQQRVRFDKYVKRHHQAVKLFIAGEALRSYAERPEWRRRGKPVFYHRPPPWLPQLSVIRSFIQPRYVLLLDTGGVVREVYQAAKMPLPETLLRPSPMLRQLAHDQGFLTTIQGKPYLLAASSVLDHDGRQQAILMVAAPLDEQFLLASQGASLPESNVIALLTEDTPSILASSNSLRVPPGDSTDSLAGRYLTIGQGFFDYGATDTLILLASFVATDEVEQLTREVLTTNRQMRALTAAIFIAASVLLMYFITQRIQRFTSRVVEFARDMHLEVPGRQKGDQIHILEEHFHRLADAVQLETAALEHQALHDPLTELPNRKLLHNRIEQEILRGERAGTPFVLMISDLDQFKLINDTLGHHIGDLILQQAGERLARVVRRSDSVARLGGDEFGILLPETSLEQAIQPIRKAVAEFERPFSVEGYTLTVGISMGIAEFPMHGDDVNILMQRADVAMYVAKRNKLSYAAYDPKTDTHSISRLALTTDFRAAIDNRSLELFYQPKVDMRTGRVVGAETLLRWKHPKQGYIDPEDFIPMVEQAGLHRPLANWVLEEALRQSQAWKEAGLDLSTSVNLSTHSLHDAGLMRRIGQLLAELRVPPSYLTLEITESDIMTGPIHGRDILRQLARMGLEVSIDDFGTGYSSLSYLKQLPVKEIKIDRSFVMGMASDEDDAAIVRATIDLAHNLGLRVVAEGVQDEETWLALKRMSCDVAQGFFISRPLPADAFTDWLTRGAWGTRKRWRRSG